MHMSMQTHKKNVEGMELLMAATCNRARSAQAGQVSAEQQVQASQATCEELQRTLSLEQESTKRLQEELLLLNQQLERSQLAHQVK